uniref:Uncharacterized protein n=1 Tax=Oryza brachyantha TaxID=4533 RepID=J3MVY3_ORYBR
MISAWLLPLSAELLNVVASCCLSACLMSQLSNSHLLVVSSVPLALLEFWSISGDQTLDINVANEPNGGETKAGNNVEEVLIDNTNDEVGNHGDHIDDTIVHVNLDSSQSIDIDTTFHPDIFDPRYWDSLNCKQVDILAKMGHKRDLSIQKGPKD